MGVQRRDRDGGHPAGAPAGGRRRRAGPRLRAAAHDPARRLAEPGEDGIHVQFRRRLLSLCTSAVPLDKGISDPSTNKSKK